MQSRRIEKINSLIRETLAKTIQEDAAAELGMITVTSAHVSPDIREVKVFVEIMGEKEKQSRVLAYLEDHRGQYQTALARLELKFTPSIGFVLDTGSSNVTRVEELLDQIKKHGKT